MPVARGEILNAPFDLLPDGLARGSSFCIERVQTEEGRETAGLEPVPSAGSASSSSQDS